MVWEIEVMMVSDVSVWVEVEWVGRDARDVAAREIEKVE